jgi:hypothetical protein
MGRWTRAAALIALFASGAIALPDEERHLSLVPWKVLEPGEAVEAPLVLFWIPASGEDLRRSDLITSDELTLYASRCVSMRVVRADDGERFVALGIESPLPLVVLADAKGEVLGTIENVGGVIPVASVEELVRDVLNARAADADERLDEAQRRADDGELDAATELYRSVWEQRCVCPRQGRAAQRALRRLARR